VKPWLVTWLAALVEAVCLLLVFLALVALLTGVMWCVNIVFAARGTEARGISNSCCYVI
jgi:hypothetical protein